VFCKILQYHILKNCIQLLSTYMQMYRAVLQALHRSVLYL